MATKNLRVTENCNEYLLHMELVDDVCNYILVDTKQNIGRSGEMEIYDDDAELLIEDIMDAFGITEYEIDDDVLEEEAQEIMEEIEGDIIGDGAYAHLFTDNTFEDYENEEDPDDPYESQTHILKKYVPSQDLDDIAERYSSAFYA